MKRIALIMSLVCCMFSASAQDIKEWSIIPNAKTGVALEGFQVVFRTGAGVDTKLTLNEHWSLLAGVEYENLYSLITNSYLILSTIRNNLLQRTPPKPPRSGSLLHQIKIGFPTI